MITDYLFREDPPYLDGRPDHVYWAELDDVEYIYTDSKWKYISVAAGRNDIVADSKVLEILNAELDEYRKENNHA